MEFILSKAKGLRITANWDATENTRDPGCGASIATYVMDFMPLLTQTIVRSARLSNERSVWIQRPAPSVTSHATVLLLDGEYYLERMNAPASFDELQESGRISSITIIYVSHVDPSTRWKESFCNDDFATFVGEELVRWAIEHGCYNANLILGGLSLTGLAAAHAALFGPRVFNGVLCQSASFWWTDKRLIRDVLAKEHTPLRFRIVCGSQETAECVEHGPGLIQRSSQLASNREMRDALLAKGHEVSYEEFDGGHEISCWRSDLPISLAWLLKS